VSSFATDEGYYRAPAPRQDAFALGAVRAFKDPALTAKLGLELARAKRLERPVPAEVRALHD
jgi:hypothetical protein